MQFSPNNHLWTIVAHFGIIMNDVSSAISDMDRVGSFTCLFDGFISSDFSIVVILVLLDSDT